MPPTAPGRVRIQLEGRATDLDAMKALIEEVLDGVVTESTHFAPTSDTEDFTAAHQMVLYVQMKTSAEIKSAPPAEKPSWMPSSHEEPTAKIEFDKRGQIARQFIEVEKQLRTMNRMAQDGLIERREFMRRLRALIVTDDRGVQWMMNQSADGWLKSTPDGWVAAVPDILDPDL